MYDGSLASRYIHVPLLVLRRLRLVEVSTLALHSSEVESSELLPCAILKGALDLVSGDNRSDSRGSSRKDQVTLLR